MQDKLAKVWVVFGQHPADHIRDVPYPTDPRVYGFPILKSMTDEVYARVSSQVRAFIRKEDAIDFSYETGLESGFVLGYRLINGEYVSDTAVTDEVANTAW